MTAREMIALLDAPVFLEAVPGLHFLCTVTNAKTAFGQALVQLAPAAGKGSAWVAAGRVVRAAEPAAPEAS